MAWAIYENDRIIHLPSSCRLGRAGSSHNVPVSVCRLNSSTLILKKYVERNPTILKPPATRKALHYTTCISPHAVSGPRNESCRRNGFGKFRSTQPTKTIALVKSMMARRISP